MSSYLGKKIILNFWAVWCGFCKAEFPYENRLYQQYKDKSLVVINICVDSDKESWVRNSKKYNLRMVYLYTDKGDYAKLLNQYNLSDLPRSVLLDGKGIVVDNYFKRASHLTERDIVNLISSF